MFGKLARIVNYPIIRERKVPRTYAEKLPWRIRYGHRVLFMLVGVFVVAVYALLPRPLYIPRNYPWSGLALGAYVILHTTAQYAYQARHVRGLCRRLVERGYSVCPKCDHELRDRPGRGTCPRCGEGYDIAELKQAWEEAMEALSGR